MSEPNQSVDIECRTAKRADATKLAQVLAEAFVHEPLANRKNCEADAFRRYVELQMDDIITEALTIIAETKEGHVAGALMALDFATPPSQELINFAAGHHHLSNIVALLDHLEPKYSHHHGYANHSLPRGHSALLSMLGVDPQYGNKGVGSKLVSAAMQQFRDRKYRFAVVVATGDISRRILDKFGFETLTRILYADYFPPDSPYSRVSGNVHASVSLMMKELQ